MATLQELETRRKALGEEMAAVLTEMAVKAEERREELEKERLKQEAFNAPLQPGDRVVTRIGSELLVVDDSMAADVVMRYKRPSEVIAVILANGQQRYHEHPKNTVSVTRKGE